jgi:DNA-binding transcriptional ArsR family regulator
MIAGAIAERQGVPPSTMSHHLGMLERAGLVTSERESRLIHYRTDYPGMQRLLAFLVQDCCQGAPEMCSDLLGKLDCFAQQTQVAPKQKEANL